MNKHVIVYIPTKQLTKSSINPTSRTSPTGLNGLTKSIEEHGIMMPCTVISTGASYQVIDGHRRITVAGLLKIDEVPCVVLNATPGAALTAMFQANAFTKAWTDKQWAEAYYASNKQLPIPDRVMRHLNRAVEIFGSDAQVQKYVVSAGIAPSCVTWIDYADDMIQKYVKGKAVVPTLKQIAVWMLSNRQQHAVRVLLDNPSDRGRAAKRLAAVILANKVL